MTCVKCKAEVPDGKFCLLCGTNQEKKKTARKPRTRGNGMGTAYKCGKTWMAQIDIGKKRSPATGKLVPDRRRKGGFATKSDALAYIPVLKAHKEQESIQIISTLSELWAGYSTSQMLKLSNSKQVAYRIAYGKLADVTDRKVNVLRVKNLQDVIDKEAPTFYPARDIKNLLSPGIFC